ncbi:uroporphyrinogen-III synthase [Marivita sp. S0852]|uniref:uroporphyrinogen-III synthase n=1 Tax=Marivita sp. S0852 TaxID=3373893 RepID=UPI003981CA50
MRPLLLLTRPTASSHIFWDALSGQCRASVDPLINPLLSIHVTGPLPNLDGIKGLIFTSANGVDAYQSLGGPILNVPVIAVGEETASAARALGFSVYVAGGTADLLFDLVVEQNFEGPLMHLRGEVAIQPLAQRLTKAGVKTQEAVLYEQRLETFSATTKEALSQDRPIIAPVFSPRTARQLSSESEQLGAMWFAAISPAVADALPKTAGIRTWVAKAPSRKEMVRLVEEIITEAVTLERSKRRL